MIYNKEDIAFLETNEKDMIISLLMKDKSRYDISVKDLREDFIYNMHQLDFNFRIEYLLRNFVNVEYYEIPKVRFKIV